MNQTSRRAFLSRTAMATAGAGIGQAAAARSRGLHLACNQYVWQVFYQREGKNYAEHIDEAMAEMVRAGIEGIEPLATSAEEVEKIAEKAKRHGLEMRSLYVNSTLHEESRVGGGLAEVLAIARAASRGGTRILVTNPSPVRWGGMEDKTDGQLACQAAALDRLGEELRDLGMTLAYHNHDSELRQAAREFHHMMVATNPKRVGLCLDAHWIYRGSGNSQVALFDVVRLYRDRIVELHLRQSKNQVWTEALGEGDIDYPRLVLELQRSSRKPHVVLEQAVESGSPHTMSAVEAHQQTVTYARRVFRALD